MPEGPAGSLPLPDREAVLEHAAALILATWRSFDSARAGHPLAGARHHALLSEPLPQLPGEGIAALDAAADVLDVSLTQARPRFFGWIAGSGLEIGVLGDALMASHDVNVALSAGAATLLERQTLRWTGEFVGFDAGADGLLAAGGTLSNLTALTAARERALPGARHIGLSGQRLALYCSAEAHYSVRRAAEVLGIGGRSVRAIAIDRHRRMDPDACAAAIDADRRAGIVAVAVVATAGTTLTGAVDDLNALADVCAQRGVWLHVDGAYGLPAAATTLAGALFAGLPRADSATVDAHKWLYVPKACSVLLVRDGGALEAAFTHDESYVPHTDREAVHPVDRTLEYSRPLSALKLWLAFRVHGAQAIAAAIERNLLQARLLADLVREDPRLELLVEPQLSAVCFRLVPPDPTTAVAHNAALAAAIAADGRIVLAAATVDGVPCLRACIVNHRTTEDDVRTIVEVVRELGDRL
ncbi:MAG: aminotransferase class V-fold PLP-dependent enzyme [Solirubrobacteraceae bacterium]|jgi:aromatic-L-amino-acid decarboxylase